MSSPRSRRDVLSLSATALLSLAGCVSTEPRSDPSSTGRPSTGTTGRTTGHGNYRHVEITVNAADLADVADAVVRQFPVLSERQRRVVSRSVADGEYVYTTYVEKPLENDTYVAYEDGYYRVDVEVAAQRQRTSHVFHLDAVSNCDHHYDEKELETVRETAVQFEDLPNADRKAFVFTHEDHLREDACFSSGYHYVYESESAVEASVLVSEDPTYVEYRDDTYVVEFRKTMPITEYDYRYTAERVAETETELHDAMARDVVIHLRPANLSADERALLDELTQAPSYEEWKNPIPGRVDGLLKRLRSHEAHGQWGRYFVEYRDEYYEFEIREAMA